MVQEIQRIRQGKNENNCKVRYVDFQKRSHMIEIESDSADRRHLEDLVKARYPAEKVYFQSVKQK